MPYKGSYVLNVVDPFNHCDQVLLGSLFRGLLRCVGLLIYLFALGPLFLAFLSFLAVVLVICFIGFLLRGGFCFVLLLIVGVSILDEFLVSFLQLFDPSLIVHENEDLLPR